MRDIQQPGRSVVMSPGGMVATSQPLATQVGVNILRQGGNAMDAAIAASATLCVVESPMTGLGGDCFLLYYEAKSQRLYGLNGSGSAPQQATPAELRRRGHATMPTQGILSVTTPGAVGAWSAALERFGRMSLDAVLQPAIHYAEDGYPVSPVVAAIWQRAEEALRCWPDSREALLIDGAAPAAGQRHCQPQLAKTMRRIATQGPAVFYEGEIAEKIAHFSRAHGGLLALDDLAAYRPEWVEPIHTDYRGLRVHELPPNSQGVTALVMLNILENASLYTLQRLSPEHIHTLTEAFKLALAERDRFVADPHFAQLPVAALLNKGFARRQWAQIRTGQVLPEPLAPSLAEHKDTTYLTVVDEQRNAVSFINSLFHPFGSGMVAGDTGVVLQNRGACFTLEEDHSNCIAPGKRPLQTIIPAMAYRDDKPVLSFGVMGGHYQALGHVYTLTNWLDFGLDLQAALDAPRFMPEQGTLWLERPVPLAARKTLARWGHRVAEAELPLGGGQCIYIDWDKGVLQGASDSRKDGCALGY